MRHSVGILYRLSMGIFIKLLEKDYYVKTSGFTKKRYNCAERNLNNTQGIITYNDSLLK